MQFPSYEFVATKERNITVRYLKIKILPFNSDHDHTITLNYYNIDRRAAARSNEATEKGSYMSAIHVNEF